MAARSSGWKSDAAGQAAAAVRMAAHGIPYAASASISDPEDLKKKVQKAKGIQGTRFIHILASCPTGWRHAPEHTLEVARLAVQSRVFPLYEVLEGENWRLSPMPEKEEPLPCR